VQQRMDEPSYARTRVASVVFIRLPGKITAVFS
jgi:hypothetical protein